MSRHRKMPAIAAAARRDSSFFLAKTGWAAGSCAAVRCRDAIDAGRTEVFKRQGRVGVQGVVSGTGSIGRSPGMAAESCSAVHDGLAYVAGCGAHRNSHVSDGACIARIGRSRRIVRNHVAYHPWSVDRFDPCVGVFPRQEILKRFR